MKENFDNRLENLFFEIILNNRELNSEILELYTIINSENISTEDKKELNTKIFGFGICDEDHEIHAMLKSIRNEDIHSPLLYKTIFEFIEDIMNIHDEDHLIFMQSIVKEEVETDMIYFFGKVLQNIKRKLKSMLSKHKAFWEILHKDFLSDSEKEKLLFELEELFKQTSENLKKSEEGKLITKKIYKAIEECKLVRNIK